MKDDNEDKARVDVQTPWFKLFVNEISWQEVIVVAMVLVAIVYIAKG